MIRKWAPFALVMALAVAAGIYWWHRQSLPNIRWAVFEGKLATLSYPEEWEITEPSSDHALLLRLKNRRTDDDFVALSVVEYLPKSKIVDADRYIKTSTADRSRPDEGRVEGVTLPGGIKARAFTTYLPTDTLREAGEPGRYSVSYDKMRRFVFTWKNGHVGEVNYSFPEGKARVYEPIFQHIVDSLKLRE